MSQTYADFRPTAMDPRGLGLDDRQTWIVAPCSVTRNSGPLAQSNWASQLAILDDAGVAYEEHRFGHWGPGWFEICIVEPTPEGITAVESLERRLSDYPVLDDTDLSEREADDVNETWGNCYRRDVERALETACDVDDIDQVPIGDLRESFDRALSHVGGAWEQGSDGAYCHRFSEATAALCRAIAVRYRERPADPRAALRWVARFRKVTQ